MLRKNNSCKFILHIWRAVNARFAVAWQTISVFFAAIWYKWSIRRYDFLSRRPHRSFRRTRRRDYKRSLKLPGYIVFTRQVNRMLRVHWRIFVPMIVIYATIMAFAGAITSQEVYNSVGKLISDSMNNLFDGGINSLAQAGLTVLASFSINSSLPADQRLLMALCLMMVWLTTVWLLREIKMNRHPRLRDGLYNASAPIMSTALVLLVLLVQLLPVGIAALLYAGLSSADLLSTGFARMLFSVFAAVIAALVLYWISSTVIALVVVTLPGMYPTRAVKAAGDLVIGRRLRIMYRLAWGVLCVLLTWLVIMVSIVMLDRWLSSMWSWLKNVPIVPYVGVIVVAWSVVWYAAYVYLLYRKVVDDDAKPA